MTCSPFDLNDFLFGELNASEREAVQRHIIACAACQDEVAGLEATRSAILCLREEEPPRRIAFVSDKVFEPKWWQRWFVSAPQLGFASAAMVAGAIVFHAVHTPAVVQPAPMVVQMDQPAIEAEVAKRVQVAVEKVVADREEQQLDRLEQFVNTRLDQSNRQYKLVLQTVAEYLNRLDKRGGVMRRTAFEPVVGVSQ